MIFFNFVLNAKKSYVVFFMKCNDLWYRWTLDKYLNKQNALCEKDILPLFVQKWSLSYLQEIKSRCKEKNLMTKIRDLYSMEGQKLEEIR